MELIAFLCSIGALSQMSCRGLNLSTTKSPSVWPGLNTTTTTTTTTQSTTTSKFNLLAPSRLEALKSSVVENALLAKTVPSDFIFDFGNATTGISTGTGGRTVAATAANFPGLINHGVAMTIGYLSPCGMNLPHTHPRATEINFSIDGDFEVGFYQENGAAFIMNSVHKNMAAVFPKGAIHFEQNLNCEPATFVAAFNSEDPGVLTIANAFFGNLPATIVDASLGGLNITRVEDIRTNVAFNPAIGIAECRKRCGL